MRNSDDGGLHQLREAPLKAACAATSLSGCCGRPTDAGSGAWPAACRPALVKLDLELAFDPFLQIATPLAHDTVALRSRTLLDPSGQFGFLLGGEAWRWTWRTTVRQPSKSFGIVAVDPVAQGLPIHATRRRGGLAQAIPENFRCGRAAPLPRKSGPSLDRRPYPSSRPGLHVASASRAQAEQERGGADADAQHGDGTPTEGIVKQASEQRPGGGE